MVNTFLEFIKRTGIFLICAESILYFVPGSSFQKYVKVLIGIMVLAQFAVPLKSLVTGQERGEIEQQIVEMQVMLETQAEEMQMDQLQMISDSQEVNIQTAEEVKSKLNYIASEHGYVVTDVILDNIAHVIVSRETMPEEDNNGIRIAPIEIGSDHEVTQDTDSYDNPELQKLQELFCEALGTGKAYLEVIESG